MEKQKAYTVLEIGWEYNDEYYSIGNYCETYEAPEEIFLDKQKAKNEWLKREIESFKGQNLANYIGEQDLSYVLNDNISEEEFAVFLKETWNLVFEDYDLEIPRDAKDEDVIKLINMMTLRFFKLHEITITE